jgi:mono/diheme cytochrome c family protein
MRTALVALLVLASAAPARAADPRAALFDAHGCRSCHRIGPRGGEAGPDLTLAGFRHDRAWLAEWLASPRHWRPGTRMPEQGLSAADRAALADFLSAQAGQAWAGRRPWDGLSGVAEGRTIYARAGCVACHGPAGTGGHPNPGARGGVIPALAPLMATYTAPELVAKISGGSTPDGDGTRAPAIVMPAWRTALSPAELGALADYLLTLAPKDKATDW